MRKKRDPKYRHHKARNLAVVRIDGKDHYLGRHGTEESIAKYHRLVADWRIGEFDTVDGNLAQCAKRDHEITILELTAKYAEFANGYYVKNGRFTQPGIRIAIKYLRVYFGTFKAIDFGPKALNYLRDQMIADGHSRRYINDNIHRIKRCFRWATTEELIPGNTYQSLRSLPTLKKGRSNARETAPVTAVGLSIVQKTVRYLSDTVADMVRVQLLTATRPSEVCEMSASEIDCGGHVWVFAPRSHKTEHHAKVRTVLIGPEAQRVLKPYLEIRLAGPMFRSRLDRAYTTDGYRLAIRRACKKARVQNWRPNQLRHTRATEIRAKFGLEAAQVCLGHVSANVTQIYAERNLDLATKVATEIG